MKKRTFYITEKYLRSPLLLFPIFAYTKNFLENFLISIWISLCIILPALIINQINFKNYRNHILGLYLLIIGIYVSLTYLFMYYITPELYKELKFSIPILITMIISFHKNEPFKVCKNPITIMKYSKIPIITFISLNLIISFFREILNTGSLKLFNSEFIIIKNILNIKTISYSSNCFLLASLSLIIINMLINIKEKKND